MKETVKRSIEFPTSIYSKLEEIAVEFDIPISTVIKIACIEYIKRQGKEVEQ